jgi:hypothetical protein
MSKLETVTLKDRKETGRCILVYAPSGYGKTYSALTLPGRLLIINAEKKPVEDVVYEALEQRGEPDREVTICELDNFDQYIKEVGNLKIRYDVCGGDLPYDSIFFDGLSFAQSEFKLAMEDDRFEYYLKINKREDILTDRFRFEIPDWGGIASMMKRITFLLTEISKLGANVVCTAWAMEHPSWNRSLDFAPYFVGKEYSKIMMGYFNIIGMLVSNPNTVSGYPPVIRFKPTYANNFLARAGNYKLTNNPYPVYENGVITDTWVGATELDFSKIINVIKS